MKTIYCVIALAFFALQPVQAQETQLESESLPLEDLQIFAEIFGKIKSEYVDKVDDKTLLRDAVRGMLNGLDPHSTFLEPDAFSEIRISTEGKFGGLGIEVTTEDGFLKVVAPIDDTPAHEAGILSGDTIIMLDDIPVRGMDLREAVEKMRGKPGTEIKLLISREGESEPLEIKLVRAVIKVTSVKGELLEGDFGYVRISSFQRDTAQNLRAKIKKIQRSEDQPLKGLVLDLRNNPGGILGGAVEVSDLFLGSGEIVSTRGRNPNSIQSYDAKPDDVLNNAPMVVIVNGGSASASEIVAGALQDHRRAIIIGTQTFGKGSVQTVIPMNNGGGLKLTTARYYTPSDRSIQAKGIVPDIITEQLDFTAPKSNGRAVSEANLVGHLANENGEEKQSEAGSKIVTSALLKNDYQLREALNLLKGMSLVQQRTTQEG